ncbi:uncharacterized protein C11orf95 [Microcaecilia unicolor]|uniref:Uncharacterized protein C11orf95-like n=1 Tax=Microcaecilia unicolor TaxID=1415580 RepID=A0A6P7ZDR6_9AMPH|nr:uncharacterized protein C11orf95-like [Microcaecilia unicolor]
MSRSSRGASEEPPESDPAGVKLEETEEEGEEELLLDASGLSCSQGSGSRDSDLLPSQELSWSSQDSSSSLGPTGDGGLLLLQPATGRRHGDHCEDRASRPGKSRIPGRDHRRYYHSHWRMEYLMDFDPRCHGMICMVCGSSLATLKLSTIKRHIRQKHPYSVNWSVKEKEVIINSWDAHLSMETPPPGSKEANVLADGLQGDSEGFGLPAVRRRRRRLAPISKRLRQTKGPQDTKNLEQYLNESLQSWFRVEFLMDYDSQKNKLFCMLCGNVLPTLSLDDIKQHVLEAHPTSLSFTEEEKCCILGAWNTKTMLEEVQRAEQEQEQQPQEQQLQEQELKAVAVQEPPRILAVYKVENPAPASTTAVSPVPDSQELNGIELDGSMVKPEEEVAPLCSVPEMATSKGLANVQGGPESLPWEGDEDADSGLGSGHGRGRDHRRYYQERWRMEYLMDYNCLRHGLICMVCGSSLATLKMSTIKRHIKQKHPDTSFLNDQEKILIVQEWNQKIAQLVGMGAIFPEASESFIAANGMQVEPLANASPDPPVAPPPTQEAEAAPAPQSCHAGWEHGVDLVSWEMSLGGRRGRGRGQRRYFQERWRMVHLVDQNESRNGLVCMVCGVDLPAMKLSVIKAHVQESHPDSAFLSPQEKAAVVEKWVNKLAQLDMPDLEAPSAEIEMEVDSHGTLQPVSEDSRKQKSPPPLPPPPPPPPQPQQPAPQEPETPAASAPAPYRGQRRNYQLRWRGEYMMDYDCRRHGLICMVCGGTLATLKISTIKRHILQVHPHSIEFGAAEKQRVLEAYSEMALHYIHTEECFRQAEDPGLHAYLLCAGRATSSRGGGAHEPVTTAQPPQSALRQHTEDVIVV